MKNNDRLFSLDILRGLDMFLLTVIGPLFWAVNRLYVFPDAVQKQFHHYWGGFTLWDIIMPLFIFMCGAAIPYALSKRLDENGRPTRAFWTHVLTRFVFLWFCGLLVQGNLATLDILKINPYSNTLQTIAVGYVVAALVMLIPVRAIRIACPVLLAATYGLLLHFCGDYSQEGNFANVCETKIFQAILPAGNDVLKRIAETKICDHGYTWFLTSLMFGFMTLCGAQCAEILRGKSSKALKAFLLFLFAAVLLGAGWGLVYAGVPMIKHIFTVSFTCQAMGWSVLALAILYVLTDVLMLRRGWWIITLFGQCALTAYMTRGFFGGALNAAATRITGGVPHLLGLDVLKTVGNKDPAILERIKFLEGVNGLVVAVVTAVLLTIVCWARRRMRVGAAALRQRKQADEQPALRTAPATDNGAVAARFRIPGMPAAMPAQPPKAETPSEPVGPQMSSTVRLQLHKPPETEPAPAE